MECDELGAVRIGKQARQLSQPVETGHGIVVNISDDVAARCRGAVVKRPDFNVGPVLFEKALFFGDIGDCH